MKKLFFVLVALAVVSATTAVYAATVSKPVVTTTPASCVHKLLFSGKIDVNHGEDLLVTSITGTNKTWSQLNAIVDDGCQLRVVKMMAAGGGSGKEAFNCSETFFEDGDRAFHCKSAGWNNGDTVSYSHLDLRFDADGKVYYIADSNENVGSAQIKLFQ